MVAYLKLGCCSLLDDLVSRAADSEAYENYGSAQLTLRLVAWIKKATRLILAVTEPCKIYLFLKHWTSIKSHVLNGRGKNAGVLDLRKEVHKINQQNLI